jgi:ornithine cyclodeaminase
MGSDQPGKNEIDPKVVDEADLYVCDRISQAELLGELRTARASGYLTDTTPAELGEIIEGKKDGRHDEEAITVCDLTGTGAQDTAIANLALKNAATTSAGTRFDR